MQRKPKRGQRKKRWTIGTFCLILVIVCYFGAQALIGLSAEDAEAEPRDRISIADAGNAAAGVPGGDKLHKSTAGIASNSPAEVIDDGCPECVGDTTYQSVNDLKTDVGKCFQKFLMKSDPSRTRGSSVACTIPYLVMSYSFETTELQHLLCSLAARSDSATGGSLRVGRFVFVQNGANYMFKDGILDINAIAKANPERLVVLQSPVFSGFSWAYNRAMEYILSESSPSTIGSKFALFLSPNAAIASKSGTKADENRLSGTCQEFSRLTERQVKGYDLFSKHLAKRGRTDDAAKVALVDVFPLNAPATQEVSAGLAPYIWKPSSSQQNIFKTLELGGPAPTEITELDPESRVGLALMPALLDDSRSFFISELAMNVVGPFDENFLTLSSVEFMVEDWRLRCALLGFRSVILAPERMGSFREKVIVDHGEKNGRGSAWPYRWSYESNEQQAADLYMRSKWGSSLNETKGKADDTLRSLNLRPFALPCLSPDMWILDSKRLEIVRDESEFPIRGASAVLNTNTNWGPCPS